MRIGLFDSGIGGLTVARSVRALMPTDDLLYLGDTARNPYGTKSPDTIVRYARECAHYLVDQRIDALVIACNTASSVALDILSSELSVPVVGVISGACRRASEISTGGHIGVIGTEATIRSGAYQVLLKNLRPTAAVTAQPCPLFVPVVEEGLSEGPVVDAVIEYHLETLRRARPDTVILACTHYPLLANAIRSFLGADVRLIECGETTAEDLARRMHSLRGTSGHRPVAPSDRFLVTDGLARVQKVATTFFPEVSAHFEQIPSF